MDTKPAKLQSNGYPPSKRDVEARLRTGTYRPQPVNTPARLPVWHPFQHSTSEIAMLRAVCNHSVAAV